MTVSGYYLKRLIIALALALTSLSSTGVTNQAAATLVVNGNGTLTDSSTGLMWVQDASYSATVGASANGTLTWSQALQFVANVDAGVFPNFGFTDWRLPSAFNPDGTLCNSQPSGANCTLSEMGHLFFADGISSLGGASPFTNNFLRFYWTGTSFNATLAMTQDFEDGGQNPLAKTLTLGALLVRQPGTSQATPEPSSLVLLGVSLVGMFYARRQFGQAGQGRSEKSA